MAARSMSQDRRHGSGSPPARICAEQRRVSGGSRTPGVPRVVDPRCNPKPTGHQPTTLCVVRKICANYAEVVFLGAGVIEQIVPVATGLAGVSLAGYLVHYFTKRRAAEARYDDAITAVARVQSERHAGNISVPGDYVKAQGPELAKIEQQLSVEGVQRFLEACAEARAALAALHAYSPDLRRYWDKLEIAPEELDTLTELLVERRRKPTKRHTN